MAGVNNNLQFETSKEVTVYVPLTLIALSQDVLTFDLVPRPVSFPFSPPV
jgi:hypothetical protein